MQNNKSMTIIFICALLSISSLACVPKPDIRDEAFASLEQIHKSGIQNIDAEIISLETSLGDIKDKYVKLGQVTVQIGEWIQELKNSNKFDDLTPG